VVNRHTQPDGAGEHRGGRRQHLHRLGVQRPRHLTRDHRANESGHHDQAQPQTTGFGRAAGHDNPLLRAALEYAAAGMPVLPLHTPVSSTACSCRRPCDSVGKHPRLLHGLRDATTDPAQVRQWWAMWPQANVGVVTGVVMDVCDIDSEEGLQALLDLLGDAAFTGPTVATGSGGWHVWLGVTGLGNRVGMLPGVDWRGTGGYVVAPPSLHATGRRYAWIRDLAPTDLQSCPPALRTIVEGPTATAQPGQSGPVRELTRYVHAAVQGEISKVLAATAPRTTGARRAPGNRNDTLNRAAFALGQLVGAQVLDRQLAERELAAAARQVGLGPVEAARTIHSGLTAGARRPRRTTTGTGFCRTAARASQS
jgi:hypothetical protein